MWVTMRPDSQLAAEKYRALAATYDRRTGMAEPIRRRAIARLDLQPGDVVLDVACGTGVNFSLIREAIEGGGRVLGIDLSPARLAKARERVEAAGWRNVTLIESAIEEANIRQPVDAALFSFTHDVMRSPRALENVLRHVKPGGRVVATGSRWARWWVAPVNLVLWYAARQYTTTLEGYHRPWSHLADLVPDLRVEPALFSGCYIAWGRTRVG